MNNAIIAMSGLLVFFGAVIYFGLKREERNNKKRK